MKQATLWEHTHSDKKDTLTGLEAWLLMCSEAVQHVNMFLGVCLFVFVNVCVGSMRESVRGAEEKTHKKPPDRAPWQQQPNLRASNTSKKPAERSRVHADPSAGPSPDRREKLNRNEKTEHVERSCFGVSCYVTEIVDAKNGKVK